MTIQHPNGRTFLAAGLVLAGLAAGASAQDLYKSQAEILNAAALNKQGDAAIINAMATFGKSQAEAGNLQQEIRQKEAHNDLLEAETYYKKRAQYHAYRDTQRANVSPGNHADRARQSAPTLTFSQFTNESGTLRWPTLFNSSSYDSLRRRIDEMLEKRTSQDCGAGSRNCVRTLAVVDALKVALRENVRRYAASDYLVARKFLDAVALEARRTAIPPGETLDRVAGR